MPKPLKLVASDQHGKVKMVLNSTTGDERGEVKFVSESRDAYTTIWFTAEEAKKLGEAFLKLGV